MKLMKLMNKIKERGLQKARWVIERGWTLSLRPTLKKK
jgi:hypothetical protein